MCGGGVEAPAIGRHVAQHLGRGEACAVAFGQTLADLDRARLAVQRMIDLPPPAVPARYDMVKARHHVDVELI